MKKVTRRGLFALAPVAALAAALGANRAESVERPDESAVEPVPAGWPTPAHPSYMVQARATRTIYAGELVSTRDVIR